MALGREAIYSTFFAQLVPILLAANGVIAPSLIPPPGGWVIPGTGLFNYVGRRSVATGGLPAEQYPAFFFLELGEIYDRKVLLRPARVTIQASGVVQSMHGLIPDDGSTPDINTLADFVEDAVNAACGTTAQNTLNGLVQQAWIDSRQVTLPASYANQWAEQLMGITMVLPHSR